jgi:hypothetical protein
MILHEEAEKVRKWIDGWHIEESIVMPLLIIALVLYAAVYDPATIAATLAMLVALSPVWLPLFLGTILWITWVHYAWYQNFFKKEFSVVEVQLPAEVLKSPAAMEVFFTSFWTTGGETTFIDRVWKGGFRSSWSLEIASNEGRIGFYIYGPTVWMPAIEARIYGQFPEAKVFAVDDYVPKVPFNLEQYDIWGCEYMKGQPHAQPFKTYIDFELDKNTDTPEIKVDPLTNLLEIMNNMGKDQYLWYQVIIRAHNAGYWYGIPEKHDHYVEAGKAKIAEIMKGAAKRSKAIQGEIKEEGTTGGSPTMSLTDGERDIVKGIERSFTKSAFDVGVRILYIAKKEKYQGITGGYLFRIFQVLKSNSNSLGGWPGRGMIRFDYPWEDIGNWRENTIKKLLHFHYKYRAYFYVPYDQEPSVMTTEELATIWHFPTSAVQTPGLNRVASKTFEGPTNLPTLPGTE